MALDSLRFVKLTRTILNEESAAPNKFFSLATQTTPPCSGHNHISMQYYERAHCLLEQTRRCTIWLCVLVHLVVVYSCMNMHYARILRRLKKSVSLSR